MKKLFVLIISLFILLPIGVNAESYDYKWVDKFCNDSGLTNCASYQSGWFNFDLSTTVNGNDIVKDVYIGGVSYNTGLYNSFQFPINISFYADTLLTSSSEISTTDSTYAIMVSQGYSISFVAYNNNTASTCSINGYTTSDKLFQGIVQCPLISNGSTIPRIRIFLDKYFSPLVLSEQPNQTVGATIGFGGGFVLTRDSTNSIVQAQQGTTNAINGVNNSINDSSTNSNTDNQNVINDFNSKLSNNNTISSLITMPITIFQKILNSVNASCTPFTLGNLLGTNITMPCINLANYLGSNLWNVIDVIISGLFVFSISKTMIKVFNNFTSLKDKGDILGGVD